MINFDLLNSYMDHDQQIIRAIFSAYMEDYSDGPERFNQLFSDEKWSDLFLLSHSIKSVLSSFGATTAVSTLINIEKFTRQDVSPFAADITLITKELVNINQQIEIYLSSNN
ncbi:Hpt domain-containing protein [Vibrio campbellii]|uniref:Hpt domain-containing protein n=1 Tax=Vibrio campbellii TaxID=680 RepID=UPI003AAFBD25